MCKNTVHPVFSTSFGLHVAVLTADKPQKFIFARRSNRGKVKLTETCSLSAFSQENLFHNFFCGWIVADIRYLLKTRSLHNAIPGI